MYHNNQSFDDAVQTRGTEMTAIDTSESGFRERMHQTHSVMVPEGEDDFNGYVEEPILLPQSTNSLLYTEPICSLPFMYALTVFSLSVLSLMLAMANNLNAGKPGNPLGLPVQVDWSVRVAQYVAIMVGLLMEEEIPSCFYLLQMIPKHSLKEKLPPLKYWRFVSSAILRLVNGYLFIFNMFLVIAQGTGVLDIFYDCLALQFLQVLDNIAFGIAKMGSFGKRLKWATNKKLFMVEFKKPQFSLRKNTSRLVKVLYVLNLSLMLSGMIAVSFLQESGALNCDSVAVLFPDDIWQDAIVVTDSGEMLQPADLIYSYFNGVYKRNGTHDGLPVFVEQSKVLSQSYETTIPAQIKYCKSTGSWVFMHPNIRKSDQDDDDCPWLLRSPITSEYDLLDVSGDWTVWTGSYKQGGSFRATCNECSDISECNYHGQCLDGKCHCTDGEYFGYHCEHKRPCQNLIGDLGDEWTVMMDPNNNESEILAYDRPTYIYRGGFTVIPEATRNMIVYTGSRWFAMRINATDVNGEDSLNNRREFHAFWMKAYNKLTTFVSDPASDTSPIAVDFYNITDRGPRYGPLGQLTPLNSPSGSGYFQCDDGDDASVLFN